ncbi:MAG: protein-glutamate O-methyltransferase CheR [Sphingomonadales bacterium]|nr:protein-glutamate O-methyltransferase CheR [Sphingomonadales bacterium]
MIRPQAVEPSEPIKVTRAVSAIAAEFERQTGQVLATQRLWRVDSALTPLLRDHGLKTLDQLALRVSTGVEPALTQKVVDALLNQETSFFRDRATLDMVADAVVEMRSAAPTRRLRIWSAGCASGQEPLSLAILLDERGIGDTACDIVATDVSADSIARAKTGEYSQFEIQRGMPMGRMITWFAGDDATWSARRDLVMRIQYRTHNLVFESPPPGKFDLILCRNVMLYFAPDVRRRVLGTLADALRPYGLLVMGAGETTIGQTDRFEPSDRWRGTYTPSDRSH